MVRLKGSGSKAVNPCTDPNRQARNKVYWSQTGPRITHRSVLESVFKKRIKKVAIWQRQRAADLFNKKGENKRD